jgi:diguanylate cyclase (GGDEF)-like protein/PAS domain S-box-containing protein
MKGNLLYRLPLSVSLSLLLLLFGMLFMSCYVTVLWRAQQEAIVRDATLALTGEVTRLQRHLQEHLDGDDVRRARDELASLGTDLRVRLALLGTPDGQSLAALRRTDAHRPVDTLLRAANIDPLDPKLAATLSDVRTRRGARVLRIPEAGLLLAAAPVDLPDDRARLGQREPGLILLGWDLHGLYRVALSNTLLITQRFLPLLAAAAIAAWAILQLVLGKRLRRLATTATRISEGDIGERSPVDGSDEIGRLAQAFNHMTDVLAAQQARLAEGERRLSNEKERLLVTLASIADGVITTDTSGRITFLNPIAEDLTGCSVGQAKGRPVDEVLHVVNEANRRPSSDLLTHCPHDGQVRRLANPRLLIRPDGREFAIEHSTAPIRDRGGKTIGHVLVLRDVTCAREMANRLSWQASHDGLTGLYNRAAFEERLQELVHSSPNPNRAEVHTLLYIDLDQFKVVNDVAGHIAGDEVLKQVGALMQQQVRDSDMLARLGGDEFGVILKGCDLVHARRVCDGIHCAFEEFKLLWGKRQFRFGASIGAMEFSPGETSLIDLLRAADLACYTAKNAGRRRTHIYRIDDVQTQRHRAEMDWATRLSDAVDNDRLVLFGQLVRPLRELGESRGLGFEVLVRMREPDGTLIPPRAFLPAAERYDLMTLIDRWILTRAFHVVAACLQDSSYRLGRCALNLSGASLGDEALLPYVREQLALHGLPPDVLCFEITETAAISNFSAALNLIRELRAMGCRFALDDFGSGLSSFSYLKNLPVDYLKIDGSFVRDLRDDPFNRTLVSNINEIGHLLGKQTVAECAEDAETIAILADLGVDYAQGFGVARPQPLEEILALAGSEDLISGIDPSQTDFAKAQGSRATGS